MKLKLFRFAVCNPYSFIKVCMSKLGLSPRTINIRSPRGSYLIEIRSNTSDWCIFSDIYVHECYRGCISRMSGPINFIIDGSANIGASSLWFAEMFPDAVGFAYEPDSENFDMLKKNCYSQSNVKPHRLAISNRPCMMQVVNPDSDFWARIFREALDDEESKGRVAAVGITDILNIAGQNHVDILKLDVEGTEREIFSMDYLGWINRVNCFIIELHEATKGKSTFEIFFAALQTIEGGYSSRICGENLVIERREWIK